ncbi:chloroplastic membrane metallo proteases [Actinidia rufa]|uniref:Chloroplastic membrane metallo proteases n=1 Tax=Actinidia rufa TaxID=165716 RepID=A0A7J0DB94_9ERIC|nr:chloroplastic membrane metallo proteases [Actinidia rufa]
MLFLDQLQLFHGRLSGDRGEVALFGYHLISINGLITLEFGKFDDLVQCGSHSLHPVQPILTNDRIIWGRVWSGLDFLYSSLFCKVSGPIAIIAVDAEVAKSNIDGRYQFAALLNLNLAVINLLPLLALDGGTLALILIEAARVGRKLPLELEQRIMSSGIMLVIFVGLFLIIRDTLNLDFIKDLL